MYWCVIINRGWLTLQRARGTGHSGYRAKEFFLGEIKQGDADTFSGRGERRVAKVKEGRPTSFFLRFPRLAGEHGGAELVVNTMSLGCGGFCLL